MMDLTRDRPLLTTVLVAAQLPETVPEARMMRAWAVRAPRRWGWRETGQSVARAEG
jgi:hypothetical protein